MSKTFHHGERRLRIRSVRKNPPDLRRLSRALIELARAQAEAEAEATHQDRPKQPPTESGHGAQGDGGAR